MYEAQNINSGIYLKLKLRFHILGQLILIVLSLYQQFFTQAKLYSVNLQIKNGNLRQLYCGTIFIFLSFYVKVQAYLYGFVIDSDVGMLIVANPFQFCCKKYESNVHLTQISAAVFTLSSQRHITAKCFKKSCKSKLDEHCVSDPCFP